MKITRSKALAAATVAVVAVVALSACGTTTPTSTQQGQATTEQYSQKLTNAQPYPLSQMNDSAERANLRERLLRMNDPNKIGYFYELTQNGQIIAEYTIKGKVTSTGSQLTNTNLPVYSGSSGISTVDSMGDDGSYGPNEGGNNGVFFFTTNGGLIEYNGIWNYSDIPLTLTSKPLITVDANAKPSSTAGQLK
jgi:hypothetical protein